MTVQTHKKSTIQAGKRLFTVEEYYKMAKAGILKDDERVELLNGEIITMSPINSFHASIVDVLNRMLGAQLYEKAFIKIQNPIRLESGNEPEPDLAIVHLKADNYRHRHPIPDEIYFIIEVAESSLGKDRNSKRLIYARAGIPEYWLVNIPDQQIEVFRKPENGDYQEKSVAKTADRLTSTTTGFVLEVEGLLGDL